MEIPEPHLGLVVSYSYLWRYEAERGAEEGQKYRPCAVVLLVKRTPESHPVVSVAPITHSPPADPSVALEIPLKVKKHLGLDGERSWIILDEWNEFTWPGYNLWPISRNADTCAHGSLPPKFFEQIANKIGELGARNRTTATPRDE